MTDGLLNAYLDYKTNELVLVERKGNRVWFNRRPAEYSCSLRKDEIPRDVYTELCGSDSVVGMASDGDYWRVRFADRDVCRNACKVLPEKRGVITFDGDIAPARRYLTDTGRKPVRPRGVYLDIETDSRVPFSRKEEARVLCWTLVCAETGREMRGMLGEDTDASEATLLRSLWNELDAFDQVLSWNGDRFDFEVIKARTKQRRIVVQPRRWLWLDHMDLFERMNTMAAESGDEKQSMALESIAQAVLGYGKTEDFDSSKTWYAWESGDRKRLADYCARDTNLMREIEIKTGYIELFHTICDVCGVFPDSSGLRPTVRAEGFLLSIAKRSGFRFKTRLERGGEEDKYKGAYVLHPTKSGILKTVQVCDFSSLYPSIIITWNASPETRVLKTEGPRPAYVCEAPGTGEWFDTRVTGILPLAVREILELRKFWSQKEKECEPNTPEWVDAHRRVTACKITANAFYGVIGSPGSRFFDRYVAEAITQAGAWLIKSGVIREAEARGYETFASDTDSAFVLGATSEDFRRFIAYCNEEMIPALVQKCGCAENRISLGYDKEFERLIIPVDDDGKPIAKRYVGRIRHKGGKLAGEDSKAEIKGFEYMRGDSARLTRSMQKEIIDLFCKERCEDPNRFAAVCAAYKAKILNESLELSDVKVSKALGKPLKEYIRKTKKDGKPANLPPHVEIALILEARGRDVGEGVKIDFVTVDGAAKPKKFIPAEDWTGEFDRFELWENYVWPASRRLLVAAFPEFDFFEFEYARDTRKKRKLEFARKQLDLLAWIDNAMAAKQPANNAASGKE